MDDVLLKTFVCLFWVLGFLAILAISRIAGLWPLRVTVPQLFIIKGLLVSFAGYPLLLFQVYDYRVSAGITDTTLIALATISAFLAIFIPILVFGILRSLSQFIDRRTPLNSPETEVCASMFYWGGLFFVIVAVTLLYLQKVPSIALFEAFSGGDVALARSKMTNDFAGKYHWFSLFFYDLAWLVTLVFYVVAVSRRRLGYWCVFFLVFSFTAFSLTMTGQKGPFVWLIGTVVLTHYAIKPTSVISWKAIVVTVSLGLSILVVLYVVFMGVDGVGKAMFSISSRALTGQISGAYNYQWIFPEHIDYLMGRSLPNPREIFPFENFRLTTEVAEMVRLGSETEVVGSQPTMYWGEAYANFSWLGVLIVPLYVGMYLFLMTWLVSRIRIKEVRVPVVVWSGLQLSTFANSGFAWSLLPTTLVVGMIIIFFHEVLCRRGKRILFTAIKGRLGELRSEL